METTNYYNAKPSNISNLGKDVSGAKRMNFDTYETIQEKEARKQKNSTDKAHKEAFKAAILASPVDKETIIKLLTEKFSSDHGFCVTDPNSKAIIMERKKEIWYPSNSTQAFNKMVSDYNRLKRTLSEINSEYYFPHWVKKMIKKYSSKETFIDQTGAKFSWKEFKEHKFDKLKESIEFLKTNSSAVQFGNSVSDKERAYILQELASFIKDWQGKTITSKVSLASVNWSFGSRGNAQSVAYFQPKTNVISVNRDNIGSLIHELGHFLDFNRKNLSNKISYATIQEYASTLPASMDRKQKRYYCSRVEIFARAFEAYCYQQNASFSGFAQLGSGYLPKLNEELTNLIEEALQN